MQIRPLITDLEYKKILEQRVASLTIIVKRGMSSRGIDKLSYEELNETAIVNGKINEWKGLINQINKKYGIKNG